MSGAVLGLAALVALGWAALAVLGAVRSRSVRFLGPDTSPPPADAPEIAVIVPAHNEDPHIAATLECLRKQDYPRLMITVVDDQSTDDTAAIAAERPGVRLVRGIDRPAGWVGKTWALHQGVAGTSSEWLCFIDADMRLHAGTIRTAWREAEAVGADLVSLLGRPVCTTFWQGSVAVALLYVLSNVYPLGRVNDPKRPEALAHGAFVLVRRSWYDRVGGMASVRGEIVEDIQFARRIKAAGGRLRVRAAPELSQTHIYGSLGDIVHGLRKNAFAGMDYRFHKYLFGAGFGLVLAWIPPLAVLVGGLHRSAGMGGIACLTVGLGGWIAQALAMAPMLVYLDLPIRYAFSFPAGITAYVGITTLSVWHYYRGRVLWKDRAFEAPRVPADPGV